MNNVQTLNADAVARHDALHLADCSLRHLRSLVRNRALTERDAERLLDRIEKGLLAAGPYARPTGVARFTLIQGGR